MNIDFKNQKALEILSNEELAKLQKHFAELSGWENEFRAELVKSEVSGRAINGKSLGPGHKAEGGIKSGWTGIGGLR